MRTFEVYTVEADGDEHFLTWLSPIVDDAHALELMKNLSNHYQCDITAADITDTCATVDEVKPHLRANFHKAWST